MKSILAFIDKTVFKKGNILFFFFLIVCFFSRLNSQIFFIDIFSHLGFQIFIGGILLFFILLFLKRFWASMICIFVCVVFTANILSSCNHCNAVLMTLLNGKTGESYNISANNEIDNLTVVRKILEIMNKSEDLIEFVEDRPGHDFRYSMDSTKISNKLGWKIKSSFDEGLEKTVRWYLDNPELLNNISATVLEPTPWKSSN